MGHERVDMSEHADDICRSVDSGRPVVGYPDKDLNVGVAYGYEEAAASAVFLWNAYGRSALQVQAKDVGPWLLFLDAPQAAPSPAGALVQALTTPNWRRASLPAWNRKPGQDARYLCGPAALRQWREDLDLADRLSAEQRKKLFFVSWWCFDCLTDARHAAARFLNERAQELDGEARSALAQAAGIYGQWARNATEACFDKHEAFLGPWTGKTVDDWSADVRAREQAVLAEVEAMDTKAAGEIDKAVSALG